MTQQYTRLEINCETGEQKTISLTEEEIADLLKSADEWDKQQAQMEAEKQAQAQAKASALAKLTALGLTEEEAKAIAGN